MSGLTEADIDSRFLNPLSRDPEAAERSRPVRRRQPASDSEGEDDSRWRREREQRQLPAAAPSNPRKRPALTTQKTARGGNTVLVTNLDSAVTENDLTEIFESVGQLTSVTIDQTSAGKSKGTAEVIFARAADATRAVEEYDSAEVDQRPMYVVLAGKPAAPRKLVVRKTADGDSRRVVSNEGGARNVRGRGSDYEPASRWYEPPAARLERSSGKGVIFGSAIGSNDYDDEDAPRERPRFRARGGSFRGGGGGSFRGRNGSGRGGGRGRGRGGSGGRGRGGGRGGEKVPNEEDLDKELDNYRKKAPAAQE